MEEENKELSNNSLNSITSSASERGSDDSRNL